jgi:DNA-nicking Smr family endonuclease
MGKNKRSQTGDDSALWETVARTATPLRRKPIAIAQQSPNTRVVEPAASNRPQRPASKAPRPAAIDRRTARRIAKGAIELDARLDLHGLTQAEAHRRLLHLLEDVQGGGGRLVLVITGKGTLGGGGGVLRRMLPGWLVSPPFRVLVAGFEEAHRNHGGAGAFYIRLRRAAARG